MGYLYERRGEGANKTYRLSSFYINRTATALNKLFSSEATEVTPQASPLPKELRRFLDKSGKLTTWPVAKQQDKLLILEYLVTFFEPGHVYSEKEVNALLLLHSVGKDAAALRGALYEFRFMNRTNDGAEYWLTGTREPEQEQITRIAYTQKKPLSERIKESSVENHYLRHYRAYLLSLLQSEGQQNVQFALQRLEMVHYDDDEMNTAVNILDSSKRKL